MLNIKYTAIVVSAISLLITNSVFAQKKFSRKELREDFAVMKKALQAVHPGLHRYNTPEEMEAKFDALEEKLNRPLGEGEFYKLIAQLLSETKCYHTYLNPFNQQKEIKQGLYNRKNYFPFYFRLINKRMIVTESASRIRLAKGSEISKVNDVAIETILNELLTVTSGDGNGTIETRLNSLELDMFSGASFATFDVMFPLFFPPENGVYRIEAIDFNTGRPIKFAAPAMSKSDRVETMMKRYGKAPSYDDGWSFEFLDEDTAYLNVSNFITWKLGFKYKEFLAKSFSEIRAKGVKNLIIDIRGNGGGDSDAPIEILRYLTSDELPCKPEFRTYIKSANVPEELFKYIKTYDKQIEAALKNGVPESFYRKADNGLLEFLFGAKDCKPYKPQSNNFKGRTYMLIDPANSSAAFTMAKLAKKNNLATLVGRETGGNRRGFNGGSYLFTYLPNSKFEIDIPVFGYFSDKVNPDGGIAPEYIVDKQPGDIGNGIDRELDKAKTLIRSLEE